MVYGYDAVTDRTLQKVFSKCREEDFFLENAPRSLRPSSVNNDQIAKESSLTELEKFGYMS